VRCNLFRLCKSVHDGHLKIDHDGVDFCAAVFCNRFLAVGGFIAHFPVVLRFQKRTQASHQRAVIHYEYASAQRSDCGGLSHTSLMLFQRDTFITPLEFRGNVAHFDRLLDPPTASREAGYGSGHKSGGLKCEAPKSPQLLQSDLRLVLAVSGGCPIPLFFLGYSLAVVPDFRYSTPAACEIDIRPASRRECVSSPTGTPILATKGRHVF
jgi:hypothetical protein